MGLIFQFKQAEETAKKLDLDGIVVIGGDDSNTNACLLAENFRWTALFKKICFSVHCFSCIYHMFCEIIPLLLIRSKNLKTRVIGCPKTIDGDLKCKEVPISFGFDTACRVTFLSFYS